MTAKEIKVATLVDEFLGLLSEYVLQDWPSMKAEVQKELQQYWEFRDEIAITDGITMKN